MTQTYGYIRVSTKEQNEDRQLLAMEQLQIPPSHIFMDKQSGKDFHRPAYRRLMRQLRQGDVLYVKSIDRLGRNYSDVMEQWRMITKEKCADIVVIDMPLLDTTISRDLLGTFISDIVLQLLSFVAENERSNIRQRQAEGIAAARLRGVHLGRPPKDIPENFISICQRWQAKEISTGQAIEESGMCYSTFYRKVRVCQQKYEATF